MRRRVLAETNALGISIPQEDDPCHYLDQAYWREERWAKDIYHIAALGMGILLANIQTLFDFPLWVWKGTFALHVLEHIESEIRAQASSRIIDPTRVDSAHLRFVMSPDPANDALYGAAALFRAHSV